MVKPKISKSKHDSGAGIDAISSAYGNFSDKMPPMRPWKSGKKYARPNNYDIESDRGLILNDKEGDRLERAFALRFDSLVESGKIKKKGDNVWFACETSDKHGSYIYQLEVNGRYDFKILRRVHESKWVS